MSAHTFSGNGGLRYLKMLRRHEPAQRTVEKGTRLIHIAIPLAILIADDSYRKLKSARSDGGEECSSE